MAANKPRELGIRGRQKSEGTLLLPRSRMFGRMIWLLRAKEKGVTSREDLSLRY